MTTRVPATLSRPSRWRRRFAASALTAAAVIGPLAGPASAEEASPSPCDKIKGVGALLRPVDALRCALGRNDAAGRGAAGDRRTEVQTSSVSFARPADTGSVAAAFPPLGVDPTPGPQGKLSDCTPPDGTPVPDMVASIFRCRMLEAGYPEDAARYTAAEALVIAQCESGFDPAVVVFDGKYLDTPHPRTGSRYSAAGVFQFIRKTADSWIEGGYANVKDPVKNIDAAARLYLHNLEAGIPAWSDWACAAANDGFKAKSELPGWPGGPAELPAWAFEI